MARMALFTSIIGFYSISSTFNVCRSFYICMFSLTGLIAQSTRAVSGMAATSIMDMTHETF